jgi:hypothetical protein
MNATKKSYGPNILKDVIKFLFGFSSLEYALLIIVNNKYGKDGSVHSFTRMFLKG